MQQCTHGLQYMAFSKANIKCLNKGGSIGIFIGKMWVFDKFKLQQLQQLQPLQLKVQSLSQLTWNLVGRQLLATEQPTPRCPALTDLEVLGFGPVQLQQHLDHFRDGGWLATVALHLTDVTTATGKELPENEA